MYHKLDKRPGKPNYYLCSSNYNGQTPCGFSMIDATKTDRDIWVRIRMYTKSEKFLAERIAEAMDDQKMGDHEQATRDIERKLKALDKEEKGISEMVRYAGFTTVLGEQMKEIQAKRAELTAKLILEKSQVIDKATVNPLAIARQIKARFWSQETPQVERKALLGEMVHSVSVADEAVTVRFRVPDAKTRIRADRGSWPLRA
jgi:hypothetical protein